jgi:hypothetical protein
MQTAGNKLAVCGFTHTPTDRHQSPKIAKKSYLQSTEYLMFGGRYEAGRIRHWSLKLDALNIPTVASIKLA